MNVDIAVLQEMNVTGGIGTKFASGYAIIATDAVSHNQGGVALVFREADGYEVEETKIWHANVISFQIVTGR